MLLLRVDDEHRARQAAHRLDAAQRLLQLDALTLEAEHFLLGQALEGAVLGHLFDRPQALDRALDRLEVGERAAEPAVGHVVLTGALGLFLNDFLRLLLGADEQHRLARRHRVDDELVGLVEQLDRVLQVDDVDAVARGENEFFHLGVPPLGLVTEVNPGLQQLTHRNRRLVRCLLHRFHCQTPARLPRQPSPADAFRLRLPVSFGKRDDLPRPI